MRYIVRQWSKHHETKIIIETKDQLRLLKEDIQPSPRPLLIRARQLIQKTYNIIAGFF